MVRKILPDWHALSTRLSALEMIRSLASVRRSLIVLVVNPRKVTAFHALRDLYHVRYLSPFLQNNRNQEEPALAVVVQFHLVDDAVVQFHLDDDVDGNNK